jgi:hypothetical protein
MKNGRRILMTTWPLDQADRALRIWFNTSPVASWWSPFVRWFWSTLLRTAMRKVELGMKISSLTQECRCKTEFLSFLNQLSHCRASIRDSYFDARGFDLNKSRLAFISPLTICSLFIVWLGSWHPFACTNEAVVSVGQLLTIQNCKATTMMDWRLLIVRKDTTLSIYSLQFHDQENGHCCCHGEEFEIHY